MTRTRELPAARESALATEAAREGLPPAEYAARALAAGRFAEAMPETEAELVTYWGAERGR